MCLCLYSSFYTNKTYCFWHFHFILVSFGPVLFCPSFNKYALSSCSLWNNLLQPCSRSGKLSNHQVHFSPEQAISLKNEGNEFFKEKQYKKAILAYTAGLQKKCGDQELSMVLHTNRAAAHFYLGGGLLFIHHTRTVTAVCISSTGDMGLLCILLSFHFLQATCAPHWTMLQLQRRSHPSISRPWSEVCHTCTQVWRVA